ncbi:MAG: DUF167 domain-containing protein [Dehalococcoidales bacterium]
MNDKEAKLAVQVQPNARRNQLLGQKDGVLQIRIAAPPTEGKANRELAKYLGGILGIAKSRVVIQKGARAKRKLIIVKELDQDRMTEIIDKAAREETGEA